MKKYNIEIFNNMWVDNSSFYQSELLFFWEVSTGIGGQDN